MKLPRNSNIVTAFVTGIFVWLYASVAMAQQQVQFQTKSGIGYGRILATWPKSGEGKDIKVTAKISNGVLVVQFNQVFQGDLAPIKEGLSKYVALTRMGSDGKTLRIALRNPAEVRTSSSYNVFAIDLLPPDSTITPPKVQSNIAKEKAAQTAKVRKIAKEKLDKAKRMARATPALPLKVRFAQSKEATRIIFDWTDAVDFRILDREGGFDLIFDRAATPSLAALNAAQPDGLLSISSLVRKNKTIVQVNIEPGFSHRTSHDGPHIQLDLFQEKEEAPKEIIAEKVEEAPPPAPIVRSRATRKNPVPATGIVPVKVTASGDGLHLGFGWAAPVGAAVFHRGDTVWILFDARAQLNINELRGGANRHILSRNTITGPDYCGVRIRIPPSTQVEARPNGDGTNWVIVLDDRLQFPLEEIELRREADGSGPGRLAATIKNAMSLLWVKDKDVGDTLAVITGTGPAIGMASPRRFVEVSSLVSAQGMAFEINADNLNITLDNDLLHINSRLGLNLTPSAVPLGLASNKGAAARMAAVPAISASPGFIDFAGWKHLGGDDLFHTSYSALLRRVAIEDTNPEARMTLAKFLIAHELGAEALGALSLAQALDPMLVQDARFRSLRGVANLQMHRISHAQADFAAQTLNRDPSAALWRGFLAVETEDWTDARQNFEKGREAFYLFTPEWQARFHTAFARAALNLNDLGTAKAQLREVFGDDLSLPTQLEASMTRAEFLNRSGQTAKSVAALDNIIAVNYEPITVRAILMRMGILQSIGEVSPLEASDILENLRYRWRGDQVELEAVRELGSYYSQTGDYRRAMEAMSLAVRRFPNSPVVRRLQKDMNRTFLELFLDGGADVMDPVQAVALFFEFQEFAPPGADGDRMIRRMADRLITFDLLPQAAELLQYQVDKKLFGLGKAQVATDLALVYLMDKKPEKALQTIHRSRQARLPKTLNQERRILEARALMELGRLDHALDLIEMDRTKNADYLRANIIWQSKDWDKIAKQHAQVVRRHIRNKEDISNADASLILRTTIAAALNDDKEEYDEMIAKWAEPMANSDFAEAYQLIANTTSLNGVAVKDLARTIGATKLISSYLDQYRTRLAKRAQNASLIGG